MNLGGDFTAPYKGGVVLLFEDQGGGQFAVGPVYTDGGIREVRALIEGRGYRNRGTVPLFTRVKFTTS